MPKEIIAAAATVGEGGYHLKVGWTRDRTVQVGMEGDEGRSIFWMLTGTADSDTPMTSDQFTMRERARQRRLAEIGAHVRAGVASATGTELAFERAEDPGNREMDADIAVRVLNALDHHVGDPSSVWTDLDRTGCNNLIRSIRKARDAAYGRDE